MEPGQGTGTPALIGDHISLEPLARGHAAALAAASAAEAGAYQWSMVPQGLEAVERYIATALEWVAAGTAVPFAIIEQASGAVLGSTRFFALERWAWPAGHERHGRPHPDGCEIGYTWLAPAAMRTAANTEAKRLMLAHAFEHWGALRVCLHTDVRNLRSRAAIERIGGRLEGILRSHRLASDFIARDSARYSILAAEWPALKRRLAAPRAK